MPQFETIETSARLARLHAVEQFTLVQAHDFFATPTSWLAIELQVSIAHTLLEAGTIVLAPNLQDGLCSSILIRLLSLGMVRRDVVVDRGARYVMIDARYLWLIRRNG